MQNFAKLILTAGAAAFLIALGGCGGGDGRVPPALFDVGGTVVNLAGTNGGLVLQDNAGDEVTVSGNGSFTFSTTFLLNAAYSVTVLTQPSAPAQICGVTNGSGTISNSVENVVVNCGHNEWTWVSGANSVNADGAYGTMGTAGMGSSPGARQTPMTWVDATGDEWLFGGYGFDSAGTLLPMNDVWKYSNGGWTWVSGSNLGGQKGTYGNQGTADDGNTPGARFEAVSWTDKAGNVWLFGGNGYDSAGTEAALNDLWKYSNGEWTWISGSNVASQKGTYGVLGVASASNVPGARYEAVSWTDASGNFWLFGGFGYDSTGTRGELNDLWEYSGGEWMWVSGSDAVNQNGIYGMKAVAAAGNVPGARYGATGWTDTSGNLWLFGGTGFPASGIDGLLSDMWEFSNGKWTWVSGAASTYQAGTYGTVRIPSGTNAPGSRQNALGWLDSAGNFWLGGGNGMDSVGATGLLNDLWKYNNGEWTWISGANLINQMGVYGSQGTPALANVPGARLVSGRWIDTNGNLVLMGGFGEPAAGSEGDLNDLWSYLP
jgi:hypothetical protein